jgi:flagellar basal body rod protein FlgG
MLYGLYLSSQGADVQSLRQDVITNNLANASTNAFKRDLAIFQAHPPFDIENAGKQNVPGNLNDMTGGISLAAVATDFSSGPLMPTGGTYDVALAGPGFLRVSDGRQEFLTRNGRLAVNEFGEMVTQEGHAVLGAGGVPIAISPDAENVQIRDDGTVLQTAGGLQSEAGRLDVVQPESYAQLVKVGNSYYRNEGGAVPAGDEVNVRQGFLEGSGTKPVAEMMEMIAASRAFEANVNMIKYQDESLGRLLQSLPRR